jgi:type IV pilus assembly protein PilP
MKYDKFSWLSFVFVSVISLSLLGCGNDHRELREYITKVKERPAKPIKAMPVFEPVPVYRYGSSNRRSPFKQPVVERRDAAAPDLKRKKEFLESYALDSLQLVGFFMKDEKKWALITAPDQSVHPVKVGNYLGQNHGRIMSMGENDLKVEERILLADGWKPHEITLILKDQNAEK